MNNKLQSFALISLICGLFACSVQAYYNPGTGNWLTRDPVEERGGNNVYAFTANSPLTFVDGDGRQLFPGICKRCGQVALAGHPCIPPPKPKPLGDGQLGFEMCRRDALGNDCRTRIANAYCGGAHSFLRRKYINAEGDVDYSGWGWGGKGQPTHSEGPELVKPKYKWMVSCAACAKTGRTLQEGEGARKGKTGITASDDEIWECIQNVKPSKPYSGLGYNCWEWAKEAASNCGISCPTPPKLDKPPGY